VLIHYVCVVVVEVERDSRPTLDLIESYKPILYFIVTLFGVKEY